MEGDDYVSWEDQESSANDPYPNIRGDLNPDPFSLVGTPHSADVANTSAGGGVWNGVNKTIDSIFSPKNVESFTKVALADVTRPRGPDIQYVGAVNPPPGDWLSKIFLKNAQPNVQYAQPLVPASTQTGISKTVWVILAGVGVLLFVLLGR